MNAYELADEAYKKATTKFDYDVALTMKQLIQENKQQADRIAELEDKLSFYELKDLDTPQTKPLSDEEILSEWSMTSYDPKTFIWSDDIDADLIMQFARAIEAKVRGQ